MKRGLYLSFEEFINNSPSITSDFELVPRSHGKQFFLGGGHFDIILKDTLIKKSFLRQKVWGLCTGDSVYLNAVSWDLKFDYTVIKELGRYCYLESVRSLSGALKTTTAFILNVNNGKFFELDYTVLETMLDSDPELLARYKQEKRYQKREVMLAYLREYNQRNRFEIDLLGQEPEDYSGKVVLFRKIKKEDSEGLEVSIDNGNAISMKPGKTFTLEIKKYSDLYW
ncbi:MAG: DUF6563 family protein [Bacteroidota bacterium]